MYLKVEILRGNTNTHCTALIVNKTKAHIVKYQRGYILTTQPELVLQAIFGTPSAGKSARIVDLPAGKPSHNTKYPTKLCKACSKLY